MNKLDELQLLLNKEHVDIGVFTESWFSSSLHNDQTSVPGYMLFSKNRDDCRGGGVAVYVKESLNAEPLNVIVPPELEIVWIKIKNHRQPRGLSQIILCGIYIITDSPHQGLLEQHLLDTMDQICTRSPDTGLCLLGDFNRMNV